MPKMSCWNLARGYPKVVTQITVHSAEGLEKKYANERKNCRGSRDGKTSVFTWCTYGQNDGQNDSLPWGFQTREIRLNVAVTENGV